LVGSGAGAAGAGAGAGAAASGAAAAAAGASAFFSAGSWARIVTTDDPITIPTANDDKTTNHVLRLIMRCLLRSIVWSCGVESDGAMPSRLFRRVSARSVRPRIPPGGPSTENHSGGIGRPGPHPDVPVDQGKFSKQKSVREARTIGRFLAKAIRAKKKFGKETVAIGDAR
jgi:hypothetical protein